MDIYIIAMLMSFVLAMILSRNHSEGGVRTQQDVRYFPTVVHSLLAFIPLAVVALFRWDVGVDSVYGHTYYNAYISAVDEGNVRNFEWGFYMITSLLARLKLPYFWYLFVQSAFYMVAIAYGVHKASVSPSLSVLLFVLLLSYFDAFSALRQAMSQAICVIAISRWLAYKDPVSTKKQDTEYVLTVLAASLMHTSALLYIFIFVLSRRNIGLKNMFIITGFCILLSPVLQVVFRYVGSLVKDGMYDTSGFGKSYMLLSLLVFVLCMWKYYDIMALNPRACLLINHAMITFIVMLNSSSLIQPYRIYDALKICFILTVPYIMKSFKTRTLGYYAGVVVLGAVAYFYFNSMNQETNFFREYHTVFEDWSFYTTLT